MLSRKTNLIILDYEEGKYEPIIKTADSLAQLAEEHENSDLPVRVNTSSNIIHLGSGSSTDEDEVEESLSLSQTEKDLIKKALQKHRNRRKYAAQELGISERTLYRKIKEYDLGK